MNRGRHKKKKDNKIHPKITVYDSNLNCLDVFLKSPTASRHGNGFTWSDTKEGHLFWDNLIVDIFKEHPLYKQYKNGRS